MFSEHFPLLIGSNGEYFIPKLQTKFDEEGNCLQACLATILKMELDDVPDFCNEYSSCQWVVALNNWAVETLGKVILALDIPDEDIIYFFGDSLMITAIDSDNDKTLRHAVITKGKRIVFDPMIGIVDKPLPLEKNPAFFIIADII